MGSGDSICQPRTWTGRRLLNLNIVAAPLAQTHEACLDGAGTLLGVAVAVEVDRRKLV